MSDAIQQQLVAARKNQILDAAAVVFAEKGFHPTTIRDVAKQAGIADGTIYNYFDSKTALLLAIFDRMKATILRENVLPVPEDMDFRTFVKSFLQQPLTALKGDNFALFRIIVSEMMVSEELRTLYYQQILEPTLQLAEGFFTTYAPKWGYDISEVRLKIRAISGMVFGILLERIMGDPEIIQRWDELPDFLTDLIIEGLDGSAL
jgi:AcrR family transcriptional regulator